ncbi:hypothetical protein [Pelagibacterium limicola]|uniref:hypothetical protein n=1 Tax=Pelagibacterium limicola TaxID=2791022 RepID=UPI0018AFCE35|nr:hypothetical protein [Pelagibacterium limicola]
MFKLYAALAVPVLLAGCTSLVTGGDLVRDSGPTGTIEVVNGTSMHIDVVLISACVESSYGLNRLPSGTAIAPGQSYSFTVSAGCWDVDAGVIGYGEARQRLDVAPYGISRYTVNG